MRRLIPFKYMPASWGLLGNAYLEAEAHYNLVGEELDRRLLEIRLHDKPDQLDRELLEVARRYGHISDYDAAIRRVELDHPPGIARDLALLEAEREHEKIDEMTYQKRLATLKNEPWIDIVDSGFDPSQGIDGVFFEFDWNQSWIDLLKANGYSGHSDEQIVDEWFSDVCRSHQVNDTLLPFSIVRE